jgi:signal transduction histidine kinase
MSTGTRLAALYAILFALSTLLLGGTSLYLVDRAMHQQVDDRISAEVQALTENPKPKSIEEILTRISARKPERATTHYLLRDNSGRVLAGNLDWKETTQGWFDFGQTENDEIEAPDQFRAFAIKGDGYYLVVAEDTDEIENIRRAMFGASALLAIIAAALAGAGGIWLSRYYLAKLEAFADKARAITAGDVDQRMPLVKSEDEFSSLSTSLNLMLDRNHDLLDLQRRVTGDIAHDIRTPLTRLRQKLEADHHSEVAALAITEIDELLGILNSLLRIAEIEEGERRKNFMPVDLVEMANRIVEIYAPSFEDQGKQLIAYTIGQVSALGDPELLTQLFVNLVENALFHTPRGSTASIAVMKDETNALLIVSDNGPGVPKGEETKILQRFYRLDKSRSSKGSGLGLNLVKAIADLHGAAVTIENRNPGLKVTISLQKI